MDVGGRTTVQRPWGRSTAGAESEGQAGRRRGRRADRKTDHAGSAGTVRTVALILCCDASRGFGAEEWHYLTWVHWQLR